MANPDATPGSQPRPHPTQLDNPHPDLDRAPSTKRVGGFGLRYPGSKRRMIPAIRQLINENVPPPVKLLVEPFCGGSSVSLGLLETGTVERVLLADFDPLIAAFWQVALKDTDWLIKAMHKEPVTVERWDHWRATRPRGVRNRALKCLFLNRTTFSGILGGHAGPIGGRAQKTYPIDCRFNKDSLEERLLNIQGLHREGRILDVYEARFQETFRRADALVRELGYSSDSVAYYLDPPYVEKASDLYDRPFTERDHRQLAAYLGTTDRWVLSYDKEPLAMDLYRTMSGVHSYRVTHDYTASGARERPVPGREIIFTNLPKQPPTPLRSER